MADITSDFVDSILELAPIERFTYGNLNYTSEPIHLVLPPITSAVNVITLTALADLFHSDFEKIKDVKTVFHVTSETGVAVYANESNEYAQRVPFISASFKAVGAFNFGAWMDQESFIIGLQTYMVDGGDKKYLLDLTSKITSNDMLEITDNGTSQEVTAKAGQTLAKTVDLKPRVSLAPFRTFREIEQPASDFVFRVRKSQRGTPELALFEADGGAWKLTAMAKIADFLKAAIATDTATVIY